jgi:hypothetical protein
MHTFRSRLLVLVCYVFKVYCGFVAFEHWDNGLQFRSEHDFMPTHVWHVLRICVWDGILSRNSHRTSDFRSCTTTCHEGVWKERRYSIYSFSTSAVDGGEWLAWRPSRALAPGKGTPGVHCTGGWVWTQRLEEKFVLLCRGSNLDRPDVQPVTRHYTDWANPAHGHLYTP